MYIANQSIGVGPSVSSLLLFHLSQCPTIRWGLHKNKKPHGPNKQHLLGCSLAGGAVGRGGSLEGRYRETREKYFFICYGWSIVLWTTFTMDSFIVSFTMFQPVHKE